MKKNKTMIVVFLTPELFLGIFLYPIISSNHEFFQDRSYRFHEFNLKKESNYKADEYLFI